MSKTTIKRLLQLANDDRRYKLEAYVFVENALTYAQHQMGLGGGPPLEPEARPATAPDRPPPRHVTGQELCEAIRVFALDQYGLLTKLVLNSWGIHGTGDFGEIVFNLIRIGRLRKSDSDRREDFDNVYDFENAFCREFKISVPSEE
jgi:uncharacterized repeat protein (TIGR04138 family)